MINEELVKMARLAQRDDHMSTGALYGDLADRIEQLVATNEALSATLSNLVEKSNAMLDAFCFHETQQQDEAYDSMYAALAEIEEEMG
jgi:hypothetical protein